ncbi:hypothetical protein Pmani_029389 [Petrolisthes manimaculis]|uniref:Uncharacterized protein n=1 Tax=Petrolisthes manimaculis TaxID=1843537 RepID=A0AAE1P047_9EUCA|nr:hypothetical protein Pmani_029389 [Petrolisthes manimaculis]
MNLTRLALCVFLVFSALLALASAVPEPIGIKVKARTPFKGRLKLKGKSKGHPQPHPYSHHHVIPVKVPVKKTEGVPPPPPSQKTDCKVTVRKYCDVIIAGQVRSRRVVEETPINRINSNRSRLAIDEAALGPSPRLSLYKLQWIPSHITEGGGKLLRTPTQAHTGAQNEAVLPCLYSVAASPPIVRGGE